MFEEKVLSDMTREELLKYREEVCAEIARLDEDEPTDPETEQYADWGEAHEDLEDILDDIDDLLDDLR